MLAFSMIKLEISVNIGQRLMKAAFIGPIGDMVHIQEDFLPFAPNDLYARINRSLFIKR